MINLILNALTYALLFFQIACVIFGVAVFILAVIWIQATEGRERNHEQKASTTQSVSPAPAPIRRRRRPAQGYQTQMP